MIALVLIPVILLGVDNAYWPLPITCPKCKSSLDVGHLDWDALVCTSCHAEVKRGDWILKGFEK